MYRKHIVVMAPDEPFINPYEHEEDPTADYDLGAGDFEVRDNDD